ncbi:MAG: phosphogluconate dehydrogenase (NAD(+)-dependent, decarboxylating) [Betaproteobacteria bacterium]
MEIGVVGLGRMGANMARRMARGGARAIAFDVDAAARLTLAQEPGIQCVESLAALVAGLPATRVILTMLPAGPATAAAHAELLPLLSAGDTLVDGGNAYYKDSMARAKDMSHRGIGYVDAGVSGGIHGLGGGYCLMLGGAPESVDRFAPFARLLAPEANRGWLHCGPSGAGHFAKMVHNGIEYGLMQAYAEGFALLEAREDMAFDLGALAETWRHGSVVRSWLLDLSAEALRENPDLSGVAPVVADSGEGRWTALEAVELGVPAPAMTMALMARFDSQGRSDYANKLLATMRARFGGHAITRS